MQDDQKADRTAIWDPVPRTSAMAVRLTEWTSETGSAGESAFADLLADLLRQSPCFADRPGNVTLVDAGSTGSPRSVIAIARGPGENAIALAGHYDTAAIGNYRDLASLACSPTPLTRALLDDLSGRALSDRESRARDDLVSGDFIPGRGLLDMKSGLAAGIAAMERFAANPHRTGSVVFIATPDEERESRGMRALRSALPRLMRAQGLRIVGGVNLDATSDQGNGELGRAVYAGTIGKLLPFALVVGQPSHASYPFEGISASLIGAEILRALEGNASLADAAAAEVTPPPICLEARDLRVGYEVTTPERFWLAFNWLYHAGDAAQLFARFRVEVAAALARATSDFAAQASVYARMGNVDTPMPAAPSVVTLEHLKRTAFASGPDVQTRFAEFEHSLAGCDNPLTLSRELTVWLVDAARLTGPAVVVGFAGLHYPPTRLDPATAADAGFRTAVERARAKFDGAPDTALIWRPIFHGISDMSFLGQRATPAGEAVARNTVADRLIDRPLPDALAFPVVNIGPWGREYHQRLERVHAPYAFDTLPRIILAVAESVLADSGPVGSRN